ncbi:DUF4126 domain-containing protein [Salinibacterium sp. ZJ450]|uniref:DUF4126 domain-containing protein n=1 Tax=Salinibacterium sp. ZJ450 TaxID=2708338 RepID=UPI001420E7E3|nr:DUF4126 domain-containing protein [Salinibacterium sp. ZJ450]
MLEFLAGTGLAVAAGLNAYIPLLALGLADRFTGLVQLPADWSWLSNEWVLVILAILLLIEIIADKVPLVDSVNDWLQTVVRPASGGIVFGSGAASETVAVSDPAGFFASTQWPPIVLGALIALGVHAAKMVARPALNAVTVGAAAPVVSSAEDAGSLMLAVFAILAPVLVILAIAAGVLIMISVFRRIKRRKDAASPA